MTAPRNHLTCKELVELVTDYLEARLPEPERLKFEDHLSWCPPCVVYLDQIKLAIGAAGRLTEQDVPAPAREALLHAFRQWKGKEG